jgi:hypothetical protein
VPHVPGGTSTFREFSKRPAVGPTESGRESFLDWHRRSTILGTSAFLPGRCPARAPDFQIRNSGSIKISLANMLPLSSVSIDHIDDAMQCAFEGEPSRRSIRLATIPCG